MSAPLLLPLLPPPPLLHRPELLYSAEGCCPGSFNQRNPVSALQELEPLRAGWHAAIAAVRAPPKAGVCDGACDPAALCISNVLLCL